MTARDIASAIEAFAPAGTQEQWDNAGFCIGSPDAPVKAVMVGFDCTLSLLEEAVAKGADMVVTHHPLIFGGLKKIDPSDPVGSAVIYAIKNGVAVYSAHTNADKAEGGVNMLMCSRLGLQDIRPLDESCLGFVGRLPEPLSGEDFIAMVKERFGLKVLRCSAPVERVSTVAASCGAGSSFATAARAAGADAFVTGDVSYHHFCVPEDFMIADIGHYESEVDIVAKFVSVIKEKFPTFAVYTTDNNNNNPIYYY